MSTFFKQFIVMVGHYDLPDDFIKNAVSLVSQMDDKVKYLDGFSDRMQTECNDLKYEVRNLRQRLDDINQNLAFYKDAYDRNREVERNEQQAKVVKFLDNHEDLNKAYREWLADSNLKAFYSGSTSFNKIALIKFVREQTFTDGLPYSLAALKRGVEAWLTTEKGKAFESILRLGWKLGV